MGPSCYIEYRGIRNRTIRGFYCMFIYSVKIRKYAMPETCKNLLNVVNSCIYYAPQIHKIYQVLPYSVDFKAPLGHHQLLFHKLTHWPLENVALNLTCMYIFFTYFSEWYLKVLRLWESYQRFITVDMSKINTKETHLFSTKRSSRRS